MVLVKQLVGTPYVHITIDIECQSMVEASSNLFDCDVVSWEK